ncbi:MAG: valine--tRNA ligase, partial [Patescibacteria group bacterium]
RGLSRYDLGRDEFYKECYDFTMNRSQYMRSQEKKLGVSADWTREKFTLDPAIVRSVLETFVKMHDEVDEDGNRMIYRGERIINWCSRCATALSDIEVEYKDQATKLYTFRYGKDFPFTISTTRPETKLADTAIAVHPADERYQEYIGKTLKADFLGVPLKLKVIASNDIDKTFGTGALGVTPAHSMVDYQMAINNDLEIIALINEEGKVKDGFGKFSGLTVAEVRKKIVERLKEEGLLEKEEDYQNSLSVCERCKTPIEPIISKQWFLNVDHKNFSLKEESRKVIENDSIIGIKVHPDRFKKQMLTWIDNVHDWCISRQIWWGPRIPAWYKGEEVRVSLESPGEGWIQDNDTFDTWFSSGQWAYNPLGYPESEDFKEFYPSDTMVMGRDLLPFWAFRMIILSLYTTRQIPFRNLYFTGLVTDEAGQKMSKSKGNGINPLEMVDKYGTDAVRLSLVIGTAPGNDFKLSERKIAGKRNLVNKIWNIARYVLTSVDDGFYPYPADKLPELKTLSDEWIMHNLDAAVKNVSNFLNNYEFSLAVEELQNFTWNKFADWYLEAAKIEKGKEEILIYVLKNILKLWHPFAPFVTEAIWQEFNEDSLPAQTGLLMIEKWPEGAGKENKESHSGFQDIQSLIVAIRNARSENNVEPARKIDAIVYAGGKKDLFKSHLPLITGLKTQIKDIEIKKAGEKIQKAIYAEFDKVEIYLLGA